MNGKATLQAPFVLPCDQKKCGNYAFDLYVEDRAEPGAGQDRFWAEVRDPSGSIMPSLSLPIPAAPNALALAGGDIQVHRS
jgi:hypothetical protein